MVKSVWNVAFLAVAVLSITGEARQQNVMFVMIDDMNPNIGAYGDVVAETPNMDKVFESGFTFTNMQTVKSECAPSRVSILSGRRPDQLRIWAFEPYFRRFNPKVVTLPGLFRENGYRTEQVGKVYDNRSFFQKKSLEKSGFYSPPDPCRSTAEKYCSFDFSYTLQDVQDNLQSICGEGVETGIFPGEPNVERHGHLLFPFPDRLTNASMDYCIASLGIERLSVLALDETRPFFLSIGFSLPHFPFSMPQSVFDKFKAKPDKAFEDPIENSDPNFWNDRNSAWLRSGNREMKSYRGWDLVSDEDKARAYYASVSFVDEQVGRLMAHLNSLPSIIVENTIVVFWGDHGFHLGDNGLWGKKTVLEQATRVPFGIRLSKTFLSENPDIAKNVGAEVASPLDTVDVYPTIADLCGLPVEQSTLAGTSALPLMRDPVNGYIRAAAVSQYPSWKSSKYIGYSIRTHEYRFIGFARKNKSKYVYDLKRPTVYDPRTLTNMKLYRYSEPGGIEQKNLINDPAHAHAKNYFIQLFRENDSRDWVGLKNVKPFDQV